MHLCTPAKQCAQRLPHDTALLVADFRAEAHAIQSDSRVTWASALSLSSVVGMKSWSTAEAVCFSSRSSSMGSWRQRHRCEGLVGHSRSVEQIPSRWHIATALVIVRRV